MRAFHLTADPDFQIDPERVVLGAPDGNGTQRLTNVIYVATTREAAAAWADIAWTAGRTFIAEIEYPDNAPLLETPYTYVAGRNELLLTDARQAVVLSVSAI